MTFDCAALGTLCKEPLVPLNIAWDKERTAAINKKNEKRIEKI